MDMQNYLDSMMKARRADEMLNSPQLTLGELILKMEAIADKELPVYFDVKKYRPTGIESWRGSYRELAITYEGGGSINSDKVRETFKMEGMEDYISYESISTTLPKNVNVEDLLKVLKMALGKTMTGYKGGNFLIGKTTPIWVANYGESSGFRKNKNYDSTAVVNVAIGKGKVIIKTKLMED